MTTLSREHETVKLVCFGNGGDTVYYSANSTGSGYGSPDRPHAADFLSERKTDAIVPDGTPVIDKRPAIATPDGIDWVFRGPMVGVDLLDGDVSVCPEPSPLFVAAVADNGYGTLLAAQRASRAAGNSRGPLDSVPISEYVAGWRTVGARIGYYIDRHIVWEALADAPVPIASEDCVRLRPIASDAIANAQELG